MFQDNNKNPYYNDSLFIDNNDNKNDNKIQMKLPKQNNTNNFELKQSIE